jgi:tRNA threonylcarbamoyladenosine biosynthesis protein TsaB
MNLLVIDTSGKNGSVALAREGDVQAPEVIEVAALSGGTFSAQLVPLIAALLARHGLSKTDIGAFIVVAGPGSFTGLRVGLAAIKALAEVLQKPIVPVSLLELLALASRAQGKVVSLLDAGRGELYVGEYEISGESAQVLREQVLTKDEFFSIAKGLPVSTPDIALAEMARGAGLSVVAVQPVSAEAVVRLGWRKLQAGETVSPEQLDASYMRRSDAEIFLKANTESVHGV